MFRTAATHLRRQQISLARATNGRANEGKRTMITSAQKRALKRAQISGKKKSAPAADGTKTKAGGSAATAKPPIATAAPSSGGGGGGGGSSLPLLAAGAAAATGGAYYMDLIPVDMIMGKSDEKKEEEAVVISKVDAVVEQEEAELSVAAEEEETKGDTEAVEEKTEEKKETATTSIGNRVLNIYTPSTEGRKSETLPEVSHAEGGNRVTVAKFGSVYAPAADATTEAPAATKSDKPKGEIAVEAEQELKASALPGKSLIDEELARAHASMKASVDESYLKNLEELSPSDLRIKIVQLASEMSERTKWEAVRLREFLGMKEKEVGDKYLEMMQKQRLEFEDLLARRLREQEANITKAANEALEAKEKSIESVVNAAANAQQAEYQAALTATEARLEREINAKHEAEFGSKLAEAKNEYVKDLQEKIASIQNLTTRLEKTQQNLQISRNFESGSQRAHRVSAAALALSEKMETSKAAAEEFAALKSAAVENGVIASALEAIPTSIKKGIPTLPELQGSFDGVYSVSRQAAYVPKGRSGVEGQLAGKIFATLTVPPSSDSTPPTEESEGKMADYILARAKQHIEVGELEAAVNDLDQLSGQAAFTVRDWKSAAMDRIAVDKALKVIKMECALMNKNMAG